MTQIPTINELYNPTLQALHNLGGSGANQEIYDEVVTILNLSEEQLDVLISPEKSSVTTVAYRLGWVKTYLKKAGLVENTGRGLWSLTPSGQETKEFDVKGFFAKAKQEDKDKKPLPVQESESASPDVAAVDEDLGWKEELSAVLLEMDPVAFERLFQRVLREDGFYQVDVTGRTGDGGIDVIGIIRIGGFLSFRVLVQCKRYKSLIGAGTVRDFRGAMMGRTDRGLIVTTGHFTQAAKREATRDGVPEIDLIDGEQLIDKLKELSLGVKTKVVEQIIIDREWFQRI